MQTPVNLFKQALKNKHPQIGLWMGFASDYTAEICHCQGSTGWSSTANTRPMT